jgi:PKD repeat protein
MQNTSRAARTSAALAFITVVIATAAGCGIEKQSAPGLSGPSEFGTSVQLAAHPDTLPRDGASQSVIVVTVLDEQSRPKPGVTLTMFTDAGSLSEGQVTTGSNGSASLVYTAPSMQQVVGVARVSALPVGTNIDNATSRHVSIGLLGPDGPIPAFNVTPTSPLAFQLATMDASGTTLGGGPCSGCTFEWAFGGEGTATGQIATYRFQNEGVYIVTLTVTTGAGVRAQMQRTVTVGAAVAPTAAFTFSPTDPRPGQVVNFNGNTSVGANGATIVRWDWDFGDGDRQANAGPIPTNDFPTEGTYVVQLTVTDDRGRTATITRTVVVAN